MQMRLYVIRGTKPYYILTEIGYLALHNIFKKIYQTNFCSFGRWEGSNCNELDYTSRFS